MKNFVLPDEKDLPPEGASFPRWLWFFIKPYKATFLFFTGFRFVRSAAVSILPLIVGLTIQGFEEGWAKEDPARLAWSVGPYLALYSLALMSLVLFYKEALIEDRMTRGLSLFSIRHMNRLSLTWHEAQGSGSKMQRINTARNSMKQIYMMYKWSLMPFLGSMGAIVGSIMIINAPWYFMLFFVGFVVTFLVAAWSVARPLPGLHDTHNKMLERLQSRVYEFVSAVRTVKSFNMERYIEAQADRHEFDAHNAMRQVYKVVYLKWLVLNGTGLFWVLVFFSAGVMAVYQDAMSAAAFATVFLFTQNLWNKLEEIVYMQDNYLEHRNGVMRLAETLRTAPQSLDIAPVAPVPAWQEIRLDHVDFVYESKELPALRDIDLTIKRGETVALTGKSGAGKSTLVRLLMKQMLPQRGAIMVGGRDLKHIESAPWLSTIALVPQDVELFNMSIRDNILLDQVETADEATYRAALKHAALEELIEGLPERDDTMIGERGIKLSGGQRQRLGIARAFVRKADLIIFDEATSALDSLSERVIQQALETGFPGRTIIIIAHRLSTIRCADRLVVLDDGRIVEEGGFDELLERGGAFATLWDMQSKGFQESPESALQKITA